MSATQCDNISIEVTLSAPQLHQKFIKSFFKVKRWFLASMITTRSRKRATLELDNFMTRLILQVIITWSVQQWNLLDGDSRYLITKFQHLENLGHSRYSAFLKDLFKAMQGDETSTPTLRLHLHPQLGRILVTGKMFFLVNLDDNELWDLPLPNDVFFIEGLRVNLEYSSQSSKHVEPFPLLNFLDSWQQHHGPIDGFLIGSILEYLDLDEVGERQSRGKFYTPKIVACHMVRKALEAFLLRNVNAHHLVDRSRTFLDDSLASHLRDPFMIRAFLNVLLRVTILDPAAGSGHFLEAAARIMTTTFVTLLQYLKQATQVSSMGTKWLIEAWNDLSRAFFKSTTPETSMLTNHVIQHVEKWLVGKETRLDESSLKFILMYHHVLPYTLHGVDISKEALHLARIRLILLLLELGSRYLLSHPTSSFPLSLEHFNLHQGNALIGSIRHDDLVNLPKTLVTRFPKDDSVRQKLMQQATEQLSKRLGVPTTLVQKFHPLHWPLLSSRIQQASNDITSKNHYQTSGWFNLIIGNPPYVSAKALPKEFKKLMKTIYNTARGQYDLFSLFIERSLQLTCRGGIISLIIPDPFLDRSTFAPLRELLIKNTTILSIHHVKNVFEDPTVANVIITFQKNRPFPHHLVRHAIHESSNSFVMDSGLEEHTPQQWFLTTRNHAFLLLPARHRDLVTKIQQHSRPLGSIIHVFRGEEMGKKSPRLKKQRCCSRCRPMLVGSDIYPYQLQFSGHYIHDTDIQKSGYFQPKIVIRQLGERIHAALDQHGQYVTLQAVYNVFVSPSTSLRPRFILALLNSHLMNYYHALVFKQKRLFPRILIENIRDLPLRMPTPATHELTCDLVRQIEASIQHSTKTDENSMSVTTRKFRARLEAVLFRLYHLTAAEVRQVLTFLTIDELEARLILDYLEGSRVDSPPTTEF